MGEKGIFRNDVEIRDVRAHQVEQLFVILRNVQLKFGSALKFAFKDVLGAFGKRKLFDLTGLRIGFQLAEKIPVGNLLRSDNFIVLFGLVEPPQKREPENQPDDPVVVGHFIVAEIIILSGILAGIRIGL